MFELFGIEPLILIVCTTFLFIFSCFLIGVFITKSTTNNAGIQFSIGLIVCLGVAATIITSGSSVFVIALLAIGLIFKPSIYDWKNKIKEIIKNSIIFFGIFLLFFSIEVIKEDYFSSTMVNGSWGDYSFYALLARELFQHGVESTQVFLKDYGFAVHPNIYHFFDIYLMLPVDLVKVPPLLNFLLFFLPFSYALACYNLIFLFGEKVSILKVFLAVLSVHYIGIKFFPIEGLTRMSFVDFYKASYCLIPLLLFNLKGKLKNIDVLVLVVVTSLVVSPIIFLIIIIPGTIMYLVSLNKIRQLRLDLFSLKNFIILMSFLFYIYSILSPESDNTYLLESQGSKTLFENFKGALFSIKDTLSILKFLPHFFLFFGWFILLSLKAKRIYNYKIFVVYIILISSALYSGYFYENYEGSQFIVIALITLLTVFHYYSLIQITEKNYSLKSIAFLTLLVYFVGFIQGGSILYLQPKGYEAFKVESVRKIQEIERKNGALNVIYFPNLNQDESWIYSNPFIPHNVGYLQLFHDSNFQKPFSTGFFESNENFNFKSLDLISKGAFDKFCKQESLNPRSYYDNDFEEAIVKFIKINSINTLIVDKKVNQPNWLYKFMNNGIVKEQIEFEENLIFTLNSDVLKRKIK